MRRGPTTIATAAANINGHRTSSRNNAQSDQRLGGGQRGFARVEQRGAARRMDKHSRIKMGALERVAQAIVRGGRPCSGLAGRRLSADNRLRSGSEGGLCGGPCCWRLRAVRGCSSCAIIRRLRAYYSLRNCGCGRRRGLLSCELCRRLCRRGLEHSIRHHLNLRRIDCGRRAVGRRRIIAHLGRVPSQIIDTCLQSIVVSHAALKD